MIFNRICLNVPTYKRSKTKLPTMIDTAIKMASGPDKICFSFVVNKKDTDTQNYLQERFNGSPVKYEIIIEELDAPHLAKFWNLSYTASRFNDAFCAVSMVGDDFEFRTKDWDLIVLNWMNYFGGVGIFFGDDCKNTHSGLCVNLFTSRKYIDALSPLPFMCELFPVDDIDVVQHNTAVAINRLFYIKDLKIFHNHATLDKVIDETWRRNREQFYITEKNRIMLPDYTRQCVENIKKNLPEEFENNISVLMTTKDRTDLLEKTVNTYCTSQTLPGKITIFDDCSKELSKVKSLCEKVPGSNFFSNSEPVGVEKNTPYALSVMFESGNKDAVLILDSDTIFNKYWWIRLNYLYRELKNDPDFGCVGLYNANNTETKISNRLPDLCERDSVGAFGMLVTRKFWKKDIVPETNKEISTSWDNRSCLRARVDGLKIYASSPSFLQHIGVYDGSHVGTMEKPSMSDDFLMNCDSIVKYYDSGIASFNADGTIHNYNPLGNSVLFCCYARYGDIIMASLIANQLIAKGYSLYWLTMRYYSTLVNYVSPMAKLIVSGDYNMTERWAHTITSQMRLQYPNFKYYINSQPGSPEHHDFIIQSQLSTIDFIRLHTEHQMNDCLDADYLKYRKLIVENKYIDMYNIDDSKPLCIICPGAISTQPVIDEKILEELVEKYSKDYTVKILLESLPENTNSLMRRKMIWGMTFTDCIYLLKKCSLYIGNDSGMTWASLYSKCDKIVYHRKERIDKFHNYFNKIDSLAKDVIL